MDNREKPTLSSMTEYKSWSWMKSRCLNKNSGNYKYYGGRGISVCERWLIFDNFFLDMGEKPEGTSLDRINVNGDYSPENCRWATKKEQMDNRRNSRFLTYKGETKTISQWSDETGLSYTCIMDRSKKGLPIDKVFKPTNNSKFKNGFNKGYMATEEKKTNMNVRVLKSVRDQLAGIAMLKKKEFNLILELAMMDYIERKRSSRVP